ncbi:hypothetical protein JCM10213_001044 [Rhodosporidiobolus nylandii]
MSAQVSRSASPRRRSPPPAASSVKVTPKQVVLEWRVEEVRPALAAARAGEKRTMRSGTNTKEGAAGLYLHARPQEEDYNYPSSKVSWMRPGMWGALMEVLTVDGAELVPSRSLPPRVYDTQKSNYGWPDMIPLANLENEAVTKPNAFVIRFTIERAGEMPWRPQKSDPASPLMSFFRCPTEHADVAFRMQPYADSAPSYLFGTKLVLRHCQHFATLFGSGLKENSTIVELDAEALVQKKPRDLFEGDKDEFAPFQSLLPPSSPPPATRRDPSPTRDSPARSAAACDADDGEPTQKKRKTRQLRSYETHRTFLKYLHGGRMHLSVPASDYLVYRFSPSHEPAKAKAMWLVENTLGWHSRVCSPHALYRLADLYLERDLKEAVKGFLLRSLTVENVAYEAFSALSLDFEDYQKPVVAFLLVEWEKVKQTKAMKQVLELLDGGQLPGGGLVLGKILAALSKPAEEKKKE